MGDYEEYKREEMREMAQEVLEAELDSEFNSSVTHREILQELFVGDIEKAIEFILDLDYKDHDMFEEMREELKREYLENRD